MKDTSTKHPLRVMIVDDDPVILSVVEAWLSDEGHEVITRSNPLGTGADVARNKPDLILLDIDMPALSGDRLASLLGRDSDGARVVLHSTKPRAELLEIQHRTNAYGIIEKTSDRARFLAYFDEQRATLLPSDR